MANPLLTAYRRAFFHVYGWATLRLYDELAWAYDPISRFVSAGRWDAWRRFALDYVTGSRVLELGFGTGELLLALRRQGHAAIGLDLSRPMHRVLGRKIASQGIPVPRLLARAEQLPLRSGWFDTVVSTFPAGYILGAATLKEVRRVLAPGGRLVIAGLIVQIPHSPRYPLSVVPGGAWPRLWAYFQGVAGEAGLVCTVTWRQDGRARVPVIVCTRSEEEHGKTAA
ncbi:MAG: class I SAM-dependent methyltransferase [Nitrososphaerales archaeon]